MKWMNCALALVLCLSLAILPALGSDGFPKNITDSANRTLTIDNLRRGLFQLLHGPMSRSIS